MNPWISPLPFRQRILTYGDSMSGKTTGLFEMLMKVEGRARTVDTDGSHELILHKCFPSLLDRVQVTTVGSWPEAQEAVNRAFRDSDKDDWVALDSMSDLRDMNMDWATEKVTGKDMGDFFTAWLTASDVSEIKKTGQQGFLISNGVYDLANPTWRKVMKQVKLPKCHVYMTAHAQDTGHDREDALTKSLYRKFGHKPQTEKSVGFDAATVVLMGKSKLGKREMTLVKNWGEQGGDGARDKPYDDFGMEFLFKTQGWRPGKNGGEG